VTRSGDGDRGALALAERIFVMLDQGAFTATYKYAVLLALLDLCLETTSLKGEAPSSFTTRQLAAKMIQLYWAHTLPYASGRSPVVLKQNNRGQAELLSRIAAFRERHGADPTAILARAKADAPEAYERLLNFVEWKLIEMPLPRLQVIGGRPDPFLYQISWDAGVRSPDVAAYQRGDGAAFDNRILLMPSVGEYLVRLNGLLRPFIQRRWAAMVARLNRLEEARLESFLFGADRQSAQAVKGPLRDLQESRCFYCDRRLSAQVEVDHFIPWARYPNDGIENLVAADRSCNAAKREFLASANHLARWALRLSRDLESLNDIAAGLRWESRRTETIGVATAIYLGLPDGVELWVTGTEFAPARQEQLKRALSCAA